MPVFVEQATMIEARRRPASSTSPAMAAINAALQDQLEAAFVGRPVDGRHAEQPVRRRSPTPRATDRPSEDARGAAPNGSGRRSSAGRSSRPNLVLLVDLPLRAHRLGGAAVAAGDQGIRLPGSGSDSTTTPRLIDDPVFWQSLRQHDPVHDRHRAGHARRRARAGGAAELGAAGPRRVSARSSCCRWSSPASPPG